MLARFITFPMPTLAVMNGHTYAGGVFFALCHDVRIMSIESPRFRVCLSEINMGTTIPNPGVKLMELTCTSEANRDL